MRRGEIRWYTLHPPDKRRPVLILTRSSAIGVLTGITVAPITSTIRHIPTAVYLSPAEDGVESPCVVTLDNLQTVAKQQIGEMLTSLSATRMEEVERALCLALGVDWALR